MLQLPVLLPSSRSYTDPNVTISTRDERQSRFFTYTFREAHGRDPSDIVIMDHPIFRSNNAVSDQHYFFLDKWKKWLNRNAHA